MDIVNDDRIYTDGVAVDRSEKYRLYLCLEKHTGRKCLLQIAREIEQNGELDRAAYILQELKRRADDLEEQYTHVRTRPDSVLNYELQFPELVDSFICPDQGGRRINILAFRRIEDVRQMVPILNITERDHLRVDLRTSAWILGKGLKLLVLTQSEGFAVKQIRGNNVLIEPDQHHVLMFDWSDTQLFLGEVPEDLRREEISQLAKAVIIALGGNSETGEIPDDGEDCFAQYTEFLLRLARGGERNALRAHKLFYEMIDQFWNGFHPFTTKPLTKH